MRERGRVLVVSCYELGHQPLAVASATAFLERAGFGPRAVDLSVEPLPEAAELADLGLSCISVPMHTALHTGVRAARKLRRHAPDAHICFFGLYALLNDDFLLVGVADSVVGGECEEILVGLAGALGEGRDPATVEGLGLAGRAARPVLTRLDFPQPSRGGLPDLERYAAVECESGLRRAAAIETSRGCLHECRHCPIVPVYGGRFFVVPREIVLADVAGLVDSGVTHLTFADPDFMNGPGHSMAIVREIHDRYPAVTFDVTTKVEKLLEHRARLPELVACGCIFVVSAVESLSDRVLRILRKGHSRYDVGEALGLCREAGLALRPSLLPFTPWVDLADYVELLDWVERERLIHHVDPVQFSVRLLLPPGSPLLDTPEMRPHLGPLQPERFSQAWIHPDPRMDRLQSDVAACVAQAALDGADDHATFDRVRALADRAAGIDPAARVDVHPAARATRRPPRLTEPWFC